MAEAAVLEEPGEVIPPPEAGPPAEAAPPPEAAAPAPPPQPAGPPVIVRDRFVVDTGTPIPDLDTPSAKAYAVEDRKDLGSKLFGLVCTPGLPTRTDVMGVLRGEELPGLMPLVEWDILDWAPLGQRSMIVIYDRPRGDRLLTNMEAGKFKFNEYEFPRRVIEPLVNGIKSISTFDMPHRSIRPRNVFFMDEELQNLVLGDCSTVPPGFDQPPLFEPIDRAMAQPGGRGRGTLADDIYALGVTLVVLMLGYNPFTRISEDDILKAKMEQGSYAALCGNLRLPIPMLEPLRGMLNDVVEDRWGLDELEGWLAGRKQPSIRQSPITRSEFPFEFEGRNHVTPRTLARDMARHREKGIATMKDEALLTWLRRGLDQTPKADGVRAALDLAALHRDEPQGTDEYLLAKICMILDPQAPIRYKGLSFMPDGFGPAMAVEILRRGDVQVPTEVLSYEVPSIWYVLQTTVFPGASVQQREFLQMKGFLNIRDPGYGWERCLYEINPTLPCQSEHIVKDYVIDIEHLLPALDAAANRVDTKQSPMDRHVAAFIAANFDEDIHPHLKALAAPTPETSTIGMLSLLAFLQWKLKLTALFGLSSWVGGLLGPAINTYHSRSKRRDIEKEIPRLVRKGSLPELFDLIDNAENRKADQDGFAVSCAQFAAAEKEIREIEGSGTERQTKAELSGQQTAAVMSIVMAMIVISVLLIARMF